MAAKKEYVRGMKALLLFLVFLMAVALSMQYSARQKRELREEMIAAHRVTLGMTEEEVARTIGRPWKVTQQEGPRAVWGYADRVVYFSKAGTVIDQAFDGLRTSGTAATPAPAPAVEGRGHSGNWVTSPGPNGTYHTRELQPGVSYMRSIGGG